jgi:hypothetical protein
LQERYRQLEAKEEEVKSVLLMGDDIVNQSSEENTVDLREKMEHLTKQMLSVRAKADKEKVKQILSMLLFTVVHVIF